MSTKLIRRGRIGAELDVETMRAFGRAQPAVYGEDLSLLVGTACFTDDLTLPGELVAVFVRSPHAHAAIVSVDAAAARSMPGVVAVLTAADLAGLGDMPGDKTDQRPPACRVPPMAPLARSVVRHVGEPVAVVVAEDRFQALDASEAVQVVYAPRPAVTAAHAAAGQEAAVVARYELGDRGAVSRAIGRAAHVVSARIGNPRIAGVPMEPRAAVAGWSAEEGYTLFAPLQAPHLARDLLAGPVLGVAPEKLRIVVPRMGGGFGTRALPVREDAVLLFAACLTGRPVRWRADRTETAAVDVQARDHDADITGAFDSEGRLLGMRVDVVVNVGAYPTVFTVPISTTTGNRIVDGPYVVPAVDVTVRCVATNTIPMGPYRGAGRPEVVHRIERLLDLAALRLGLDRVDIRRRNLIPGSAMPYRNNAGQVYDSGDYPAVLDAALALSDWAGFPAREAASRARGRLRGQGLCCHIDTTSGISPSETVTMRLSGAGRVEVLSGTQEMGQSLAATYRRIVADLTAIPLERIDIVQGDTARVAAGVGSYGSRSLSIGGSAVRNTALAFEARLKAAAAEMLEASADDVDVTPAGAAVRGTDHAVGWSSLAQHGPIEAEETFASTFNFPNGCYVCEVEVDRETGDVTVDRFTAVDDVGRVVNPEVVCGQVHGGVVQGIGQALQERCVYDGAGQLLTASFLDYAMPRAGLVRGVTVAHLEGWPSPLNPLGAKGAGESGAIGAPPAVVGAVVHALAPFGVSHLDMPIRPEDVWRCLQSAVRAA